ncbi:MULTISPECIES: thiol reductant ABC exporter subunit CydC [Mammaliicoccus]|jgi:ATP-binding cassette subfamily C protein CydC|uniref:Thiol reductant ABC exporter subunit CydC n=1 Tax=Mammaliicoccus sciuri TaxID=1296 RepID=A0AAW5LF36_MAMSC|nr:MULTISPECIES: thiol reductant ABC exporter subunit CydC [Mammaliicoccus]MBG9209318.1 thiol reductant ABC exporter subunit CydC [Mammaliicoccus sciuri]MCD8880653.1 thiol reductant ABC exporter subunit CydC [Mammaliicoccus sciuri]MCJ0933449.1 thiol reductant ABC exporter subunit CydC [Mammaliicoccus sciuri]MCQ9302346.1 thiol reductant ABC exporter subunit CydC [Mammaliicoccus sciuri]MDT0707996.1 thiol reductant ABC exporter subunit CydC [Mammaliicoccus sciuri]
MKKLKIKFDKDFYLSIVIGVFGMLTALGMFALSGYMISKSALGTPLYALMILIVSIKLFGFVRAITRYFERLYSHRSTFTMLRDIRVNLFNQLIPIVPNVFRRYRSSDLLTQMVNHVERLQNILLRVYYPPIVIIITTFITILVMINFNIYAGAIIGLSMLMSVIIIPYLSAKRAESLAEAVQQSEEAYVAEYFDFEKGRSELKRFQQYRAFKEKVLNKQYQYEDKKYKEQKFLSSYDFMLNLSSMVSIWCMTILCIWQIQDGVLNAVFFASILMITITLFEQAIPMTNVAFYKADTERSLKNIEEVINQSFEMPQERSVQNHALYKAENVMFKYDFQERETLSQINFEINEGDHVAIIGPSGSGKTTMLNILMGLYSVNDGTLSYKKEQLSHVIQEDYVNEINTMLQHNHYFEGTVRENLLIEVEDELMTNVLAAVNLNHLNLDQQLTKNADNISGGERQRLSLARLLLRKAQIWLLDEPTASLDEKNEENVMNLLLNKDDTIVIVTHNLKYLQNFNHIIVMNEGHIIEQGNYTQLIKEQGYLYKVIQYNEQLE